MAADSAKTDSGYLIAAADWPIDEAALRRIREQVFVQEQGVPTELEWDGKDSECLHLLAYDLAGHAIATARLQPNGKIGRMAVLPAWRGRGVGGALLSMLIERAAALGLSEVFLHAQQSAVSFYHQYGFIATGEPFQEAGITHVSMTRFTSDP